MKYSSVFYSVLFLLISPAFIFAADINLTDSTDEGQKATSIQVDTKEETANAIKVAVEVSSDVLVSAVTEGDYACDTFSSTQNGSVVEVTCTTREMNIVNASIAKIFYTSESASSSFAVLADRSQIGELEIVNTVGIGSPIQQDTSDIMPLNEVEDISEEVGDTETLAEETTTTTSAPTETEKKTLPTYLPYVLVGLATILLVSIIILLFTKEKKENVPSTPVMPVEPSQPPAEPIPAQDTPVEEEVVEKPTLQEMVNAGVTQQEPTPMAPVNDTVGENYQKDLEALLVSENPGMDTSLIPPAETPLQTNVKAEVPQMDNTLPNIGFTAPVEPVESNQAIDNTMMNTFPEANTQSTNTEPYNPPAQTPQEYTPTDNTLPNIGFTAPVESNQAIDNTMMNTFPEANTQNTNTEPYNPPTETPIPTFNPSQDEIEIIPNQSEDLQELVNSEVNSIPTAQPTTTPDIPTPTVEL